MHGCHGYEGCWGDMLYEYHPLESGRGPGLVSENLDADSDLLAYLSLPRQRYLEYFK